MPWFIVALGLGLAAGGAASIVHGYPYMRIEFGWTEVIAGTTAVSGGIVTIALGAVLLSLGRLNRMLARSAIRTPTRDPAPLSSETGEKQVAAVPAAEGGPQTPIAPPPEPLALPPARSPEGASKKIAERNMGERETAPSTAEMAPEAPVPTIAGRYESGGSAYVLFSDGTIEVDNGKGKRRFDSMEDLKGFMATEKGSAVG